MTVLALSLLTLGVGTATTSPAPSATVVTLCDDSAALGALAAHLAARLGEEGWQVRRQPASPPAWRRLCDRDPDRARALLAHATESFHNFKLEDARLELQAAAALLERSAWVTSSPDNRRVYLYLGWVERERGNDADAYFRTSVRLWPAWRPDPLLYPPDVVAAYGRRARAIQGEPTGTLTIETRPPGAIARLNGDIECSSPCGFPQLVPGEHFLSVRHPDHGAVSRRFIVKVGPPQRVLADLVGDERGRWWRLSREPEVSMEATPGPGSDLVVVLAPSSADVVFGTSRIRLPVGGTLEADSERILDAVASAVSAPPATVEPGAAMASELLLAGAAVAAVAAVAAAGVGGYFLLRPDNVRITVSP